jgi:cytochrome b561
MTTVAAPAPTPAAGRPSYYGGVAVALHWLTVVLVLTQLGLALLWGYFPRPERHMMVAAHMSLGITLGAVVLFRLIWRLMPAHWIAPASRGLDELAARAVHYLLYALVITQASLGFLLRWSGGEAMSFFGLQLPSPMETWSKAANHQVGEIHEKVGWAIIILAAGHAGAALYHHFVRKDQVLARMIPVLRNRG